MKKDMLIIEGISVSTIIGVHPWEQQVKQTLIIDLAISTDFRNAHNELSNVIDYSALVGSVEAFFLNQPFKLIETAADSLADFILSEYKCSSVEITMTKPGALRNAKHVKVCVYRTSSESEV